MSDIDILEIMRQDQLAEADISMSTIGGNPTPHHRMANALTAAIELMEEKDMIDNDTNRA